MTTDPPVQILLFWGDDTERVEGAVTAARQEILGPAEGMEAFNHETFDAAYTEGMGPVLAACKQLPMMMPQRLVELAGPEQFGKHVKESEAPDRALDRLIAYIQEPCPGALLLVSSTGLRANSRLVKAVSKSPVGREERFKAPANDREAVAWLSSLADRDGLRVQSAALHELVARVGHDTSALRSGLQRASGHAGQATVRVDDVVAVVEHAREVDVFAFTDAIGRCDHAAALRMLAAMFSRESDVDRVFGLMGLLTRHIRLLYTAQRAGTQALDLPPFIARKYDEQVRNFDERRLRAAYEGLAAIDAQIKGATRARYVASKSAMLVLQRWVLETCGALPGVAHR